MVSKLIGFIKNTSIVWKTAIGSALSWRIAQWAGSSHPYLAPITLILSLQSTLNKSVHFAIYRMFGTALGILITVLLAGFFSVSYWTIGLLIFIGTAVAKLFKMNNLVIHQIALSILLVFTFAHKGMDYGIDRLRDTIIGALVALVFTVLILPEDPLKSLKNKFLLLAEELAANLTASAAWAEKGCPTDEGAKLHTGTKALLKDLHEVEKKLDQAIKDLRYNPYSKKHKRECHFLKTQLLPLQQGYTHMSRLLRTLTEWSASGTMTAFDTALWSSYLYSLAAYIIEWKRAVEQKRTSRVIFQLTLPPGSEKNIYPDTLYHEAMEMLRDFMPTVHRSPTTS